jgi:FdrA protein
MDRLIIERGIYRDSFALMTLSREARMVPGVEETLVVLATPINTEHLVGRGFSLPDPAVGPSDLVIAIRADDALAADAAEALVREKLTADRPGSAGAPGATHDAGIRNVRTLARRSPDIGVLVVSVPGANASHEVAAGLEAGLHVFCFSSGIAIADERALKEFAIDRDLLLMGPDCGTAILDGIGFGFANVVRRGPVGIVGASGSGIQEIACLLDAAGLGLSQAIGVGSRDLSAEVGGLMTHRAIDLMADDPATDTIVVVSKPADPAVSAGVVDHARRAGKHVIIGLLGWTEDGPALPSSASVELTTTLAEAARLAAAAHGRELPDETAAPPAASPGFVRGLFCGGTLCHEAMSAAAETLGPIATNLSRGQRAGDPLRRRGHAFVDFGSEALTDGRLHPIIDPSIRNENALHDCLDPEVGVVVLDVVLGLGAHPDPAHDLAEITRRARRERGDAITVVVAMCGTVDDPQDLEAQRRELDEAGAVVLRGAARAGRFAAAASGTSGAA